MLCRTPLHIDLSYTLAAMPRLLQGALLTLEVALASMLVSLALGLTLTLPTSERQPACRNDGGAGLYQLRAWNAALGADLARLLPAAERRARVAATRGRHRCPRVLERCVHERDHARRARGHFQRVRSKRQCRWACAGSTSGAMSSCRSSTTSSCRRSSTSSRS